MAETTGIEWTDHTHNFWIGCQAVSAACDHCYAETLVKRWAGNFATRRRTAPDNWKKPLLWNRRAEAAGVRDRVFSLSLGDFFDNKVDSDWRHDAWDVVRVCTHLDWQILTKRPQNIAKMLPADWGDGYPNVWLGTTVENQEEADRRIPHLLAVPAAKRFLSCEPLLGPLDIRWSLSRNPIEIASGFLRRGRFSPGAETLRAIDWVIAGGESGPGARPMHPDWVRDLRDQCVAADVPFFFKQHGEWIGTPDIKHLPGGIGPGFGAFDHCAFDRDHDAVRVGKKRAGNLLDGLQHKAFPE